MKLANRSANIRRYGGYQSIGTSDDLGTLNRKREVHLARETVWKVNYKLWDMAWPGLPATQGAMGSHT